MSEPSVMGFLVRRQVATPSGISMMVSHAIYSAEEGGYVVYVECPDELAYGVHKELEDVNMSNVFISRVLNLIASLGLPAEQCRKVWCGTMWFQLSLDDGGTGDLTSGDKDV